MGFRPYTRDFASDFKLFRDFTLDFNVFKPDFRDYLSYFTDYRNFRDSRLDFRDFRSDFRTFAHRISEVVGSRFPCVGGEENVLHREENEFH